MGSARRAVIGVLSLAAVLCGLAPSALAAAPNGAISGKVTDASTHTAIEGIEVCAFSMTETQEEEEVEGSFGCAKTDAAGEYTISGLVAGNFAVAFAPPFLSTLNYEIQYYSGKYPPSEPTPVAVSTGSTTTGVDAALQEGAEITGTVTTAATGAPAEGVLVCALRSASPSGIEAVACTRSGANGEYTLKGIPDGNFEVGFLGLGLATQYYPGKTSFAEGSQVSIVAAKEVKSAINAAMQPGAHAPGGGAPTTSSPGTTPGSQLPGGAGTGPLATPELAVSLASPRLGVQRKDLVLVKLACGGTASCHGKLVLSARRTLRVKHKTVTRTVTIGTARYSLGHGAKATVKIKLGFLGRGLLSSARAPLVARLAILQLAPAPIRTEVSNVVLVDGKAAVRR